MIARKILTIQLVVVAFAILTGTVFLEARFLGRIGALGAIRDLSMAEYAHLRAGSPIPVTSVDYEEANVLNPNNTWGITTNSQWLATIVRDVVPYFFYVGISRPAIYPDSIAFVPMTDPDYFHLLGEEGAASDGSIAIILNERMVNGDATDMRVLLATVVHEMIHAQGGDFTNPAHCPEPKDPNNPTPQEIACWVDESPALESNTQTATIEVLASYCNHQSELACRTFWYEVEDASSSSFQVWAWSHNLGWLYDWIDKTFWLQPGQVPQYDASMHYWQTNCPDCLKSIVQKYGAMVWEKVLLDAVDNRGMLTGLPDQSKDPVGQYTEATSAGSVTVLEYPQCIVDFADVRYLFGPILDFWLHVLS